MKKSFAVSGLLLLLLCASPVFAASGKAGLALPIGGNVKDASGVVTATFAGTFFLQQFAVENNVLVGRGILSGTLTSATGGVIGSVWRQVSIPVNLSSGGGSGLTKSANVIGSAGIGTLATCDILHLALGPLDLNLLGLQVNLSEVVLDIVAQTGAGNLLGNLLCAVTNLLNGVGNLIDIANLLNQILQILNGLLA